MVRQQKYKVCAECGLYVMADIYTCPNGNCDSNTFETANPICLRCGQRTRYRRTANDYACTMCPHVFTEEDAKEDAERREAERLAKEAEQKRYYDSLPEPKKPHPLSIGCYVYLIIFIILIVFFLINI